MCFYYSAPGLSAKQVKQRNPSGLQIHPVSTNVCLVSGPKSTVEKLVESMKKEKIQVEPIKLNLLPASGQAANAVAAKTLSIVTKVRNQ